MNLAKRWRAGFGVWMAALGILAPGCEVARTEVIVRVESELPWGESQAVQSVVLEVRRGGATGPQRSLRTTVLGGGTGRRGLPLRVWVLESGGDLETPLWVEALGCGNPNGCTRGNAVVAQRAIVRFVPERTVELPLLLAAACAGVRCGAEERCEVRTGMCRPATEAVTLPWMGVVDAGADTGFAERMDAVAEAGMDATMDVGVDAGIEAGSDAGVDARLDGAGDTDLARDVVSALDAHTAPDVLNAPDIVNAPDVLDSSSPDVEFAPDAMDAGADVPSRDAVVEAGAIAEDAPSPPPRPIAPLSLGDVTQRRPTLRWEMPSGYDYAEVQLCRDRFCTSVIETIQATGASARPVTDLPARSVVFWRVRARSTERLDTAYGPVWLFHVPTRSATSDVDTSVNPHFDVNGDGFDDIVVGAPGFGGNGGASVFLGGAAGVTSTPQRVLVGTSLGDSFGAVVACAGDVNGDGYADLIVGSPHADPGGRSAAGTASLFLGNVGGIAAIPQRILEGVGMNDAFGGSVASAGDINGDGYADVVVGAESASPRDRNNVGTASVFMGSAAGIAEIPHRILEQEAAGAFFFGHSVAGAGDFNGDGYSDLVVGAYAAEPGGRRGIGTASIFAGSAMGLSPAPQRTLTGTAAGDQFGWSVASAGDVNGDGYSDLVVGAIASDPGGRLNVGTATVFHGSIVGVLSAPTRVLEGATPGGYFGSSVSGSGDFDGDGYSDLVVAAFNAAPEGRPGAGTVDVFRGSVDGIVAIPQHTFEGAARGDSLGSAVTCAGDINGDGYTDLSIGARAADLGERVNVGLVSTYFGSPVGIVLMPHRVLEGVDAGDLFGASVAHHLIPLGIISGSGLQRHRLIIRAYYRGFPPILVCS